MPLDTKRLKKNATRHKTPQENTARQKNASRKMPIGTEHLKKNAARHKTHEEHQTAEGSITLDLPASVARHRTAHAITRDRPRIPRDSSHRAAGYGLRDACLRGRNLAGARGRSEDVLPVGRGVSVFRHEDWESSGARQGSVV